MKFTLLVLSVSALVTFGLLAIVDAYSTCGCNGATSTFAVCNCALTNPVTGSISGVAYVAPLSLPGGACKNPQGASVQCLCPIDTCAPTNAGELTPGNYNYCKAPWTGYDWNATANGFYFCTQIARYAVCNGHGESYPLGAPYINSDAPFVPNTLFKPKCVCDAGWKDGPATGLFGFVQACSVAV